MRYFLGIDLPVETKKNITRQLKDFRKDYPYFSYVNEDNYHITLHYLGDDFQEDKVKSAVENVVYDIPAFQLYANTGDIFINYKITMFITFHREKTLDTLVQGIREQLQVTDQKKFVPHLTFARYKLPSKQQYLLVKKRLEQMEFEFHFDVNRIYLYESIETRNQPIYEKKAEFSLVSRENG